MSQFEFTKGTNSEHKISLNGQFVSARWITPLAIGGRFAELQVNTVLIGNGAPIEITFDTSSGKKPPKLTGIVISNRFRGKVLIPEGVDRGATVTFKARLPNHDLEIFSESVPLLPPLQIDNLRWNQDKVARTNVVTMQADAPTLPDNEEVILCVYEHHPDSGNELVTEIPTLVKDGKIRADLEFQYHGLTEEIPTKKELEPEEKDYVQPMYVFTVKVAGQEFGDELASGLMVFYDFIHLTHFDKDGEPTPDLGYKIILTNGEVLEGNLDSNGEAFHEEVVPGRYQVFFDEVEEDEDEDEG